MDGVVELGRRTLEMAVLVGAPLLIAITAITLLISVVQVLTSLQDPTLSAVPRLLIAAAATFLLMPWMMRRLCVFTTHLFSDFRPFLN